MEALQCDARGTVSEDATPYPFPNKLALEFCKT
jgi:hypothetical protein